MLKIYIELYLFYNFIRILEISALFLQTDLGGKSRSDRLWRGGDVCEQLITHYI
jgi:hypothetical protein